MKNKLIFRILGALSSALIIVSVFVPFVSVTGYSPNLWETYESINSLYLPIMIIVFGAIGVIFFALNIKTEFAYMSVGAIAFFAIMQTIDIIDQGVFNTLSIGYHFLVIGALLTGIMAFLTNLKSKKKEQVVEEVKKEETSMLDQIDKLYNDQTTTQSEMSPIQPIDNLVQPLPIQPLQSITPVEQVVEQVKEDVKPDVQEIPNQNVDVAQEPQLQTVQVQVNQQPVNPVLQEFNVPKVEAQPISEPQAQPVIEQPVNPVLQEFAQQTNLAPQEFGISNGPVVEAQNIVQQQPMINQEAASVPLSSINEPVNPTVQEFSNPGSTVVPQQNSNELDIFGQPINK